MFPIFQDVNLVIREISALIVLLNKLCMFLLLFSLARILGVELYGVFSYHYAIVTGIATVVGECLSIALSRYAVINPEKVDIKTSFGLMLWGGILVGVLSVIMFSAFPAPAIAQQPNAYGLLIGVFLLGVACVCNLTVTGLMFALDVSMRWVTALAIHGILGLIVVVGAVWIYRRVEGAIFGLAICTLVAPVSGLLIIRGFKLISHQGKPFFSLQKMKALLKSSGAPSIAGSMLLGGPIHIICLMIFARASSNVSEVGYFNLFFLFYILVTVLPSALASYAIVKLAGSTHASKLYLLLGVVISVILPALLIVSKSYWLCLLGSDYCDKGELLFYAVLAGGVGLVTTIVTQILHSTNSSRVVFLASCVYASIYLLGTIVMAVRNSMSATDLFKVFLLALVSQILVLAILGGRKIVR